MKQKHTRKAKYSALLLAGGILWSGISMAAPFNNGDFSADFTGWQGETDFDGTVDPVLNSHNNYDASTGAAILSTDFDNFGSFSVNLFQTFDVESLLLPSNTLHIAFDSIFTTDDVTGVDFWIAQIVEDGNAGHFQDLTSGGSIDITSFSGMTVELLFGLQNDIGGDDTLEIDNISFSQESHAVPTPSVLLFMASGLLALGATHRKPVARKQL